MTKHLWRIVYPISLPYFWIKYTVAYLLNKRKARSIRANWGRTYRDCMIEVVARVRNYDLDIVRFRLLRDDDKPRITGITGYPMEYWIYKKLCVIFVYFKSQTLKVNPVQMLGGAILGFSVSRLLGY